MGRETKYDDEFVEKAIVLLEANGYPDRRGALRETARQIGLDETPWTLGRWYYGHRRRDITNEAIEGRRIEMRLMIEEQLHSIAGHIPVILGTTKNVRDAAVAFGIFFDKLRLISGESTANIDIHQRITRLDTILDDARVRRSDGIIEEPK